MGAGEVLVVVARMRDQLKNSFGWDGAEQGSEGDCVESAGGKHAERSRGGGESFFRDDAAECGVQEPQQADLGATNEWGARCGSDAPGRLEWVADGADAAGPGGAQHRSQDTGKHVRVLVGVDVGEADAAGLKRLDLGDSFSFNLIVHVSRTGWSRSMAAVDCPQEFAEGGLEAVGGRIGEARYVVNCGEDRLPVDKDDVTTDAERWRAERNVDGFIGCRCARHERCAGQHSCIVKLEDGAVHASGQPEVIGVYDEAVHWLSLSRRCECSADREISTAVDERCSWMMKAGTRWESVLARLDEELGIIKRKALGVFAPCVGG